MIDKVFGHYRVVSKLGEGGMGVVFRARDEMLQRDVALKFIGQALASDARQFLLREARAISALNHPNICTVHEVGESGGEFYIVMELIEGKPMQLVVADTAFPTNPSCDTVCRSQAVLPTPMDEALFIAI